MISVEEEDAGTRSTRQRLSFAADHLRWWLDAFVAPTVFNIVWITHCALQGQIRRVRLLQSQYKNTTASAWHYLPANVRSMPAVGLRCSAYVSLNQSDPAPAARPSTRNSLSSAILKLQRDRLSRESQQAPALTSSGKSKIIIKTVSSSSPSTLSLTPDYFMHKRSANVNELISLRFWNSQGFEMLSGSWVSEWVSVWLILTSPAGNTHNILLTVYR